MLAPCARPHASRSQSRALPLPKGLSSTAAHCLPPVHWSCFSPASHAACRCHSPPPSHPSPPTATAAGLHSHRSRTTHAAPLLPLRPRLPHCRPRVSHAGSCGPPFLRRPCLPTDGSALSLPRRPPFPSCGDGGASPASASPPATAVRAPARLGHGEPTFVVCW
jgi:hypothetical protein